MSRLDTSNTLDTTARVCICTIQRMPTGLFYDQGVKANVLFFDKKPASETPWTKKLWIYDLRANMHFTRRTTPDDRWAMFSHPLPPSRLHAPRDWWSSGRAAIPPVALEVFAGFVA